MPTDARPITETQARVLAMLAASFIRDPECWIRERYICKPALARRLAERGLVDRCAVPFRGTKLRLTTRGLQRMQDEHPALLRKERGAL